MHVQASGWLLAIVQSEQCKLAILKDIEVVMYRPSLLCMLTLLQLMIHTLTASNLTTGYINTIYKHYLDNN